MRKGFWAFFLPCFRIALLILVGSLPRLMGQEAAQQKPIVVGINREFPPYEFLDPTGQPAGYDVDLIRAAAAEVGLPLVFQADTWAHIKADVEAGRVDVVPGMLYSEERAALVEFSAPHLMVHYSIFIRKGTPEVATLADLAGKRILVERSSRMHEFLLSHGFKSEILVIDSEPEALRKLSSGLGIDAAILPRIEGLEMVRDLHISNVHPLSGSILSEELCFAVAKDRGRLRAKLDSGVAILYRSGKYREIYDKWFVPLEPGAGNSARILKFLGWTTLGALLVGVTALAWSWSLRRQVHRKTESLRRSEAATRTSNARFQAIFNAANDAIFIHALPSGTILDVNQRTEEMYGYSREQILTLPFEALCSGVPPHSVADALAWMSKAAAGPPQVFEWLARDRSDRLFWVEVNMRRTTIDGQERLVVAARDIAERKRAEQEKANLQAQLQQSQKMESLGILAGGVAHDMNNILGAILALASTNQEAHPPDSPAYRAFERICMAATRGGSMVKNLLGFARQAPAELQTLDVNELLREQAHLLEHTTLSRIALGMELDPGLLPMRGDANALTHAFMNLCVNAIDAMDGQGTLVLRTRNGVDNKIEITVQDTGPGMPKEVQARAMEPFFTTKPVGKGTGLGLSMVYGTVMAHQGQMEIKTEQGKGTSVTLRLPACGTGKEAHQQPSQPEPQSQQDRLPHSRKVLLIDDDELVRDSIQGILTDLGHAARLASSGEEGLVQIHTGYHPDLVILDMNMPGLGGAGTLPQLRSWDPTVPILITTGRVDQAVLDLVASYPGVTLLAKPFPKNELRRLLEQVTVSGPRP